MKTSFRVIPAENGFLILEGDLFSARDGSYGRQWVATSAEDAGALLTSLLAGDTAMRQQMPVAGALQRGPAARDDYRTIGGMGLSTTTGDWVANRDAQNLADALRPGP